MYKGKPIKITADFSMESLTTRWAWHEAFQGLNEIISAVGYST
jgi:hypothetical protein